MATGAAHSEWRPFRGGPAWRHVLGLVLGANVAVVAAAVLAKADPGGAGEAAGRLSVVSLALGVGVSWVAQTKSRWVGAGLGTTWCLGIFVFFLLGAWQVRPLQLTAEERRPLELIEAELTSRALGFSFPHPGEGFLPIELATAEVSPGAHLWAFVNEALGESVTALATLVPSEVDEFFAGVVGASRRQYVEMGFVIDVDSAFVSPHRGFDLRGTQPTGVSFFMWCDTSAPERVRAVAVCLSAVSGDIERLTHVPASLRFQDPEGVPAAH